MSEALSEVADLYSDNLDAHGVSPMSVGWRDEAQQRLRFEKLAAVIDRETRQQGFTVNDLGCGYGAMFGYLDQLGAPRLEQYIGYDISQKMLAAAPVVSSLSTR
jgi:SAM-dependent methyltransferase